MGCQTHCRVAGFLKFGNLAIDGAFTFAGGSKYTGFDNCLQTELFL